MSQRMAIDSNNDARETSWDAEVGGIRVAFGEGRLEEVGRIGKVLFVNDSKATNAEAAARALSAFDDVFWIAGGRAKEGGLSAIMDRLDHVRGAYLIGEAAESFEEQLGDRVKCVRCGDLQTAMLRAKEDASSSDHGAPAVLLSPACASYDQFKSFVERGDRFRDLVNELAQENGAAA